MAFAGKKMFVTEGLGLDLEFSNTMPELADMGELLAVSKKKATGTARRIVTVADLAEFEDANNPTGDEENVNPNSVIAGRTGMIVADAGANDLLLVKRSGRIKVLATFPQRDVEAPSSASRRAHLRWTRCRRRSSADPTARCTSGSSPASRSRGWRERLPGRRSHGDVSVAATGFTNIIDIAFDKRGRLYVLEIFKNGLLSGDPTGALIRVNGDGSQTELMSDGLITPGGLTIRGHSAYVSNCGTCADDGRGAAHPARLRRGVCRRM